MIKAIKQALASFFVAPRGGKPRGKSYSGFSDFLRHASVEEKKKVLAEAARGANEDQMKVFNEALLKVRTR